MNKVEEGKIETLSEEDVGWKFWKKRRYVVGMLVFFGTFTSYMLRINLSMAIVAMTEKNANGEAEFEFESGMKGVVLGSFFYGYTCTQLLGGWLSAKIGGKRVFGCGIGVTAFLTLITPPLARTSVYLLIALRIIEGLFEGLTWPCTLAIWANWIPRLERSKFASLAMAGVSSGLFISSPVFGFIAENLGWAAVFYISGFLGMIWCTCWFYFVTDKPEDDPRITQQEIDFIKFSINSNSQDKDISHPWKAMLTSVPVWAIFATHFSEMWGQHTMVTQLPTFIHDVLKFNISKSGLVLTLPYIAMAITGLASGYLADYLRKNNYLTTGQVRKFFICGGFTAQTSFIILAGFSTSSFIVITCITIALGVGAVGSGAYTVNYLDIAPRHASVLVGIGNTLGSIAGVVSPTLTGFIVKHKEPAEWRIVLIIIGVIYILGAIIYGIFGSGETQNWADDSHESKSCSKRLTRKK